MVKLKPIILTLLPVFLLHGTCSKEDEFISCVMNNTFFNEFCIHGKIVAIPDASTTLKIKCLCVCDPPELWTGDKCDTPKGGGHPNQDNQIGKILLSQIQFENRSSNDVSYDILLDGEWVSAIAPGGQTERMEISPGWHQILFRNIETGKAVCLDEKAYLEPEKTMLFTCSN